MTILTSYTSATHKAQIRSSPANGFRQLYAASSTESEFAAAKSVVRKWYSNAAAETVRKVTDSDEIRQHVGDFFQDPKRKQVFNVWTFNPQARCVANAPRS
jgi:hypothetical protein